MDCTAVLSLDAGYAIGSVRRGPLTAAPWPNEPRIANLAKEQALTERYLLPVLEELETLFLELRSGLDPQLQRLQPNKLGKPYPLGQCLEITLAVQTKLREVDLTSLTPRATIGFLAIRAFKRQGGSLRQVWGDLRGQYFQNAFQLGTLYIDASNDTVVATKPKVEIQPFAQAQFIPITDYRHYLKIAASYWQGNFYPNHVLPELAPYCPLIHVSQTGQIIVLDPSQYMLAMNQAKGFQPSEAVLRDALMPTEIFERIVEALLGERCNLAHSPEQGRKRALQHCQAFRAKRWPQSPQQNDKVIQAVLAVNMRLAKWHHYNSRHSAVPPNHPIPMITIDNKNYKLDSLSEDAKAQLQSLQFCDAELQRLSAQTAVLQTARIAYANALNLALPAPAGDDSKLN